MKKIFLNYIKRFHIYAQWPRTHTHTHLISYLNFHYFFPSQNVKEFSLRAKKKRNWFVTKNIHVCDSECVCGSAVRNDEKIYVLIFFVLILSTRSLPMRLNELIIIFFSSNTHCNFYTRFSVEYNFSKHTL